MITGTNLIYIKLGNNNNTIPNHSDNICILLKVRQINDNTHLIFIKLGNSGVYLYSAGRYYKMFCMRLLYSMPLHVGPGILRSLNITYVAVLLA